MTQFCDDLQTVAPTLPPRVRCSTSALQWKDPPPSPPVETRFDSGVFSDSFVYEIFGQSKQSVTRDSSDAAAADTHNHSLISRGWNSPTSVDGNVVPTTSLPSYNPVVGELRRDGNVSQCTQVDGYGSYLLDNGHSLPAQSNTFPLTFQTGVDDTVSDHSSPGDDSRVLGFSDDSCSGLSCGSAIHGDIATGARSDDAQSVQSWKPFDTNAWHMEQEKFRQMSLNLPDDEPKTRDDAFPDLSSSDRLSVAAVRLFDSLYGVQSTSSARRVSSTRSLSSVSMRLLNQGAAHSTEQPASSVVTETSEREPFLATRKALDTNAGVAHDSSVHESEDENSPTFPSGCVTPSHLARQVVTTEQSAAAEEKCDYIGKAGSSIPETHVLRDDTSMRLTADNSGQSVSVARESRGADSSSVNDRRRQTIDTPTSVPKLAAADEMVLARRPSIKELKSRFEGRTSHDSSVREAGRVPPSTVSTTYHQFEPSLLRAGCQSSRNRAGSESSRRVRPQPTVDTVHADVTASPSSFVENSPKNSAPKGRFVTRASIAANADISRPLLRGNGQAEYRQFESLVDRRKVFEAADTQPIA